MSSSRSELFAGVKAISPILLGVVPFGTISGIAAVEAGLSPVAAVGMSLIVFAGAAQLAAVQLIGMGASPAVIVLTALVINLRFAMYSASIGPHLKRLSGRLKGLSAYVLSDQAYAVSIASFNESPGRAYRHWFYLGAAWALWVTWQICALLGIFVGTRVPESWSLDFAIPVTFLAVVVPAIKDRPAAAAALAAGLVAVLAFGLPFNLGLILGAAAGILTGLLVEWRTGASHEQ